MLKTNQFFVSSIGNALEYYDVTLYGFFAAFLGPLFFPSADPVTTMLASFGAFAAGFIVRPLGGILFGHLGDKYGRKKSLLLTLFMMVIPTFTISILPTYQQIGIFAPLILVVCRMVQGLCVGGEYPGASVFVVEHSRLKWKGFSGGVLTAAGCVGALIGALAGAVFTSESLPDWGWRIPFFLGGVMGLIALYFRVYLKETPAFEGLTPYKQAPRLPLAQAISDYPLNLLCVTFIGSAAVVPLYLTTIYLSSITFSNGLPTSTVIMLHSIFLGVCIVMMPLMGWLADKIGSRQVMLGGAIGLLLCAYPIFILTKTFLITGVIIAQLILGIFNAAFVGPAPAFETSLFPVQLRYSAIATGYGLGGALFGGTSPFICTLLVEWTGNPEMPAFYLMITAALGLFGVILADKTKLQRLPN